MNDFVSTRWVRVAALVASMLVVWVTFVPEAFPWRGLLLMSLACSAAFWIGRTSSRSVAPVVEDVDAAGAGAVVTPHRAAAVPKAVH